MDTLLYILLLTIIVLCVFSLFAISLIVKSLAAMRKDFLEDIQHGVDYVYGNQSKLNYIYKRLKNTEKKNES